MKTILLLSALPFFALSLSAQAGVVFKSGNWVLDDSLPNDPSKGICQAMTSSTFGNATTYLSLVVDKTGALPLEIFLLPNRPAINASALYAQSGSGLTWYFPKLLRTGEKDQYWQVPVDTAKFVQDLKAGSQLTVKAVTGASDQLRLSLTGATAVINELVKRCSKSSLVHSAPFEKAFLPANKDRFQIKAITPEKASRLRALVAEAVPSYYKVRAVELELSALEAKFAALTKERGTLRAELDNLKNRTLPELMNGRDAAQAKIEQATAEISDLQGQIAGKQLELAQAKGIAETAYERLRPLIPEHDRLLSLRRNDESRLDSARSDLADIDGGISREQQNVSRLNAEADHLNRQLTTAQENVRRAQYGYDEANRAYQGFDARREFQERFRRNHRVDQLEREMREQRQNVQRLQRQVQQQEQITQGHQNQVNAAHRALQQCRGHASLDIGGRILAAEGESSDGIGRPGFGGGRPGRPGRPGPGNPGDGGGIGNPGPVTPGPSPTPPPQPNCSAQEAALASAQSQLHGSQQQLRQLQYQLNSAESSLHSHQREMEQIRHQIQNEVDQIQNDLSRRVSEWQSSLQSAQSELGRIQDRLDNILRYDLPRAQNNLRDFESRRPGAVSEVRSAESALSRSTAEFNSYKRSVDYDNIRDEADRTAGIVRGIESTIAQWQRGIASRQVLIRDQTVLRDGLIKRISDTHATIAAKEARFNDVNNALAAFDTQKAEIVARLDVVAAALREISQRYSAELN